MWVVIISKVRSGIFLSFEFRVSSFEGNKEKLLSLALQIKVSAGLSRGDEPVDEFPGAGPCGDACKFGWWRYPHVPT